MVSRFFNYWMVGVVLAAWLLGSAGDNLAMQRPKPKAGLRI